MHAPREKKAKSGTARFRQGRALLDQLTDNAAVPTYFKGTAGGVFYANRAFCELLGYEPEEVIGLGIDQIVHPDDLETARARVDSLVTGQVDRYRSERRYLRKNGEPIWVLVSASILRDGKTGDNENLIVQVVDIDRQKRAEAALTGSESRWNFALEAARQGVWDHDFRNNRVFYSRLWRTMRGFGADEDVDEAFEKWIARVHPDDQARVREIVKRQVSGELGHNSFEYRERHRDGHWIWILSCGKPIDWFPDGSVARVIGTDTDITSFKQTEADLAEEKERLRVTLQSIAEGVISTDANACITFINAAAEKMTGWHSSDAVGRPIDQVVAIVEEATGQPAVNPVAECLARQGAFLVNDDVVLVSRTGERRDIRDSAAPLRTPRGAIIGAVLVFQDVTSSRALQKELAYSAMHDALTGLANRLAFERKLSKASEQASQERREHALCFIDLDRFKVVNDTAGHAAGDALLQEIGRAIRRCCRTHDFAARIGGDEFAVLLADCTLAGAKIVAQQIVDTIAAIRFSSHGRTYQIGASVGITAITHNSPRAASLVSQADTACYAAKASGRNQVAVFDGGQAGKQFLERSA